MLPKWSDVRLRNRQTVQPEHAHAALRQDLICFDFVDECRWDDGAPGERARVAREVLRELPQRFKRIF